MRQALGPGALEKLALRKPCDFYIADIDVNRSYITNDLPFLQGSVRMK